MLGGMMSDDGRLVLWWCVPHFREMFEAEWSSPTDEPKDLTDDV